MRNILLQHETKSDFKILEYDEKIDATIPAKRHTAL